MAQNTPVHVPSILLSASVEFDRAYRPGGTQTPRLDLICEDDQRVKSSVWYQGMNFAQRNGFYRGTFCSFVCYRPSLNILLPVLPVVVVTLPQGQKRRPADLPLRDQPRNLPNATLV
jgi:hypothetical protein